MATLEDLKPEKRVDGLVVGSSVTVIATSWHGSETLEVVYRTADGAVDNRLLSRSDENRLSIVADERSWTLDADGELFKLASEARRIELAHLFDPYVGIEAADIDPLPHQIEAVYEQMLPRRPLRWGSLTFSSLARVQARPLFRTATRRAAQFPCFGRWQRISVSSIGSLTNSGNLPNPTSKPLTPGLPQCRIRPTLFRPSIIGFPSTSVDWSYPTIPTSTTLSI